MKCSLCGCDDLREFLDLGQQPLANKYPTAAQFAAEDFFPLAVLFCESCKNVQLGTFISRKRMFEDYYYLSSVNAGLVRHFEGLARELAGERFVVDVGSNDGILLRPLKSLGVKAIGIEPSINVSKIANDEGLTTICGFFDAATAAQVERDHGKPGVIVASSVFTHLEDPHQFIETVLALLEDGGRFVIEVEYIGNILKSLQYERFYLDRIFYYSLTSLKHLFAQHGMDIVDVRHIEPHGGSLQVTAQRAGRGTPSERVAQQLRAEEAALTRENLQRFKHDVVAQTEALRAALTQYKSAGRRVAGYGAPARVSTICNFGKIGPELIEYTVDDSPLKQSKFTPGTHIPIVTREMLLKDRPDIIVVFAYEYLDDIRKKTPGGHRYFLPIPPREID
jgi:methylation protein EvaC